MVKGKIAVIGAGNAGQAIAGDLGLKGFEVQIHDILPNLIEDINKRKGIKLVGQVLTGFVEIKVATTNMADAVRGAEIIFITVPANAHFSVANELAGCIEPKQTVIIMPGYIGGAYIFHKIFSEKGVRNDVLIAETMTLPYSARLVGPAVIGIKGIKKKVLFAAYPSKDNDKVLKRVLPVYDYFALSSNTLVTGLNNPNAINHVPLYIHNLGFIERDTSEKHFDYHILMTEGVNKVLEKLEEERLTLCSTLNVQPYTVEEFTEMSYAGEKWKIVEKEGSIPPGSKTIPDRFITEDVPQGLVPLLELGKLAKIEMPVTEALIMLSCIVWGEDFIKTGRTLSAFGLENLSLAEVLQVARL